MKAIWQCLVVIVLASAALAGCASYSPDQPDLGAQGVDTARVAKVEAAARRAGVDVHWVNYPRMSPSQP